jgi:predicted nuclease with TOPRIM domain
LPWGEVDGVCGTLPQLKEVFQDGKGVWLHELDEDSEQGRLNAQAEYLKKKEEAQLKDMQELMKLEEKKAKEKSEQEQKEKINFERLKELNEVQDREGKKVERRRKRWDTSEGCVRYC